MKLLLARMEEYALAHHVPIVGRESGLILQKTAAASQPAAVLEIGTAIGYSTLLLAANMKPGGRLTTIELDEERQLVAEQFLADTDIQVQLDFVSGDAGKLIPGLTGYFDFVFIDAAKGQYLDYLHKVMDKLSPGAVIIADNVLFRGWVVDDEVLVPRRFRTIVKRLKAYLEFVGSDCRFKTTIYRAGDGMSVSYYQGETLREKT